MRNAATRPQTIGKETARYLSLRKDRIYFLKVFLNADGVLKEIQEGFLANCANGIITDLFCFSK